MRKTLAVRGDRNLRILVTGAGGFIGRAAVRELVRRGHEVRAVSTQPLDFGDSVECIRVPYWSGPTLPIDRDVLKGIDAIVHLAGRAHVIRDSSSDPLAEFRAVNVAPTIALARLAIEARVPKLVFASSIGINGKSTGEEPITEQSAPAPTELYAVSKLEAEQELSAFSGEIDIAMVRPALVYGPGVKGSFLRLLKLIWNDMPLPLGRVRNVRSYLGLRNVCDFLAVCAERADAHGVFIVCDEEWISTPELIRVLAGAMGKKAKLLPVPVAALKVIGKLTGRGAEIASLTTSLRVDSSYARHALQWRPPVPLLEGVAEMGRWYYGERDTRHANLSSQ